MSSLTRGFIKTWLVASLLLLVGCGDTTETTTDKFTVSTVAGVSMLGSTDAVGANASFNYPSGIVADSSGNLFIADTGNSKIRKITPAGVVSTIAGGDSNGSTDAVGTDASFNFPSGIAIDSNNNLFVTDAGNNKIRKITPAGVVSTVAGSGLSGSTDAVGANASFKHPSAIAIDSSNNLFVTDAGNNKIRKITPAGAVSTVAGSGVAGDTDAVGINASFDDPSAITIDSSNNLFVTDAGNNKIRKITPAGVVSTVAGSGSFGSTDAVGTDASFDDPSAITIDSSGNLFVADSGNSKVRKITPAGVVSTIAGSGLLGDTDAVGTDASFNHLAGITMDGSGNLFVTDSRSSKIRKITSSGVVSTVAGVNSSGSTDAVGANASFNSPSDITVDSNGNLFVADTRNNKIRKITSAGAVSTIAGSGVAGDTDAVGVNASFFLPISIVIDSNNNLFVADLGNYAIRKITPAGVVSTVAGSGSSGDTDAVGTNASFSYPSGIAIDSSDNLFVTDTTNNKIRKITPAGVVSTIAGGDSNGSTDAVGTDASFNFPSGIAIDSNNNLFVTDAGNNKIRKITPSGVVSTIAGSGLSGSTDAVGTDASFFYPSGITVDSSDNLFITDFTSSKIRKITPAGVVSTIAGGAISGSTDGVGTDASFNHPVGITIDSNNNLFVADSSSNTIRKISK